MKFKLEGWGKEAEDREITVSVSGGEGEDPTSIYLEEVEFGINLQELEQLIKLVKEL